MRALLLAVVLFLVAGWVWTSAFTSPAIVASSPWVAPDRPPVSVQPIVSRGPACVVTAQEPR